jgi:hypothetical protein
MPFAVIGWRWPQTTLLWASCGRGVGAEYFRGPSGGCPFESGGEPAVRHPRSATSRAAPAQPTVHRQRCAASTTTLLVGLQTTRRQVRPGSVGAGRSWSAVALRPVPGKVPIGVTVRSRSGPWLPSMPCLAHQRCSPPPMGCGK